MTTDQPDEPIVPDSVVQGTGLPDQPFPPVGGGGAGVDPDDLAALLGSDGGIDFGSLLEQASNMQAQMLDAADQLRSTEVEGVAGGGAVRIGMTGGYEFQSVTIDPSAVDPDDVEMLQDLVLAALNDAVARIAEIQDSSGGLNLGDLFGR